MNRTLPPNLSAAQFDAALAAWRAIVGDQHVVNSATALSTYLDPFAPGEREAFAASAALLPASVDEIRAVLRI
ncbi:MAG: FAD-binding oxidoreductase, partial [Paraburkholderia graminis]